MKAIFQKLDKLATREKMALVLATVFVTFYLLDQFVVRSIARRLKDLDAQIEQAILVRNDSLFLLARDKELKAEYERIGNTIAKAASPAEAVAMMKGEVYDAAKQNSLMINAMDQKELKDSRPDRSYEQYTVEISKFDAEMKDLMGFIYRMDTSPGLTRVVKLTITPGKNKNSATGSILLTKVMIVDNASRPKAPAAAATTPPPAAPKR